MASIRKVDGGRWRAEVARKGRRTSKRFDTRLDAERWAVEQEVQIGTRSGVLGGKTLGEALERYAREVSIRNKGARWEQIRLAKMARHPFADGLVDGIEREDIERWRDERLGDVSPTSVNRELTLLSSVFRLAVQWRWAVRNVVRDVTFPANGRERQRRISDGEVSRILAALGYPELRATPPALAGRHWTVRLEIAVAFLLAIETAMRQGEIWGLAWPRVDLATRVVTLPDTKNGDQREVPLSRTATDLMQLMARFRRGERVFCSPQASAATTFRRAVAVADLVDLRFHDTRHEACSRLGQIVPDVLHLSRITGHRDPRMLRRYFNPTAAEMVGWLDRGRMG